MPLVTLVIGLPASGKSTFLADFIRDGIPVFDDFMEYSPPGGFATCRHLERIASHLKQGRDLVLADVQLTDPTFYREVVQRLRAIVPELEIRNVCFENDPVQCLANSAGRANRQIENRHREVGLINQFSANYTIPPDAEVIPVAGTKR